MQLDIEESSAQKPWQVAEFVFGKNLNRFPLSSLHFVFFFYLMLCEVYNLWLLRNMMKR
jgi:hypothetical protein